MQVEQLTAWLADQPRVPPTHTHTRTRRTQPTYAPQSMQQTQTVLKHGGPNHLAGPPLSPPPTGGATVLGSPSTLSPAVSAATHAVHAANMDCPPTALARITLGLFLLRIRCSTSSSRPKGCRATGQGPPRAGSRCVFLACFRDLEQQQQLEQEEQQKEQQQQKEEQNEQLQQQ